MAECFGRRELLKALVISTAVGARYFSPDGSAIALGSPLGAGPLQSTKKKPSIESKVKQIIVEQLGVAEADVTPKARFVEDLGADSLDVVELVMACEEAFEIEIPDEDAEKIHTLQDAIDYIKSHAKSSTKASLAHVPDDRLKSNPEQS